MELEKKDRLLRLVRRAEHLDLPEQLKAELSRSLNKSVAGKQRPPSAKKHRDKHNVSDKDVENRILQATDRGDYITVLALLEEILASSRGQFLKLLAFLVRLECFRDLVLLSSAGKLAERSLDDDSRFVLLAKHLEGLADGATREAGCDLGMTLFFCDVSSWFASEPESLRRISTLIASHHHLDVKIITLAQIYATNSTTIHSNPFELALWDPIAKITSLKPWPAVAQLHLFIIAKEASLDLVASSWETLSANDQWEHYYLWAQEQLASKQVKGREDKLRFLRAFSPEGITPTAIKELLQSTSIPESRASREHLRRICVLSSATELELFFLLNDAKENLLSADSLERIVFCAEKQKISTLADSARAILKMRRLDPALDTVGERVVQFRVGSRTDIKEASLSFSANLTRFISSFFVLGPWLHYHLQSRLSGMRPLGRKDFRNPYERKDIFAAICHPSLRFPKKIYVNSRSLRDGHEIPQCFGKVTWSDWSIAFSRLAQLMGLNYLTRNLDYLAASSSSLLNPASDDFFKVFLAKQDKETKSSWFQMHRTYNLLEREQVIASLIRFFMRYTTAITADDLLSLRSATQCQFKSGDLRDLERWILVRHSKNILDVIDNPHS